MSDGPIRLVRLPGTYPAQADTWLLAADAGAASVHAVDLAAPPLRQVA